MKSIEFYVYNKAKDQERLLALVTILDLVTKKIALLKRNIKPISKNIIVHISESQNWNSYRITYRAQSSPHMLFFTIPKKSILELSGKNPLLNDPIILIDYICSVARKEYNYLGNLYNKRSKTGFALSKMPRHKNF